MERSGRIGLAYAVGFFAFLCLPALFRSQAPWPFPAGFYWQELLDLFTPLVLIPLAWYLCGLDDASASWRARLVFLVLAGLWVEGQAIHLAANSIARPWEHVASPTGALAQFYDDDLSHYLWHVAIDGVWLLAIVRSLQAPVLEGRPVAALAVPAMLVLGVAWFLVVVESGTAPLDVPLTAAALAFVLAQGGPRVRAAPIAAMLGAAFLVTLALLVGWAALWGGRLPQFTEVGWL